MVGKFFPIIGISDYRDYEAETIDPSIQSESDLPQPEPEGRRDNEEKVLVRLRANFGNDSGSGSKFLFDRNDHENREAMKKEGLVFVDLQNATEDDEAVENAIEEQLQGQAPLTRSSTWYK